MCRSIPLGIQYEYDPEAKPPKQPLANKVEKTFLNLTKP